MIVSPKFKLVLKPNKTRVISAEDIVMLGNISVLETFQFK